MGKSAKRKVKTRMKIDETCSLRAKCLIQFIHPCINLAKELSQVHSKRNLDEKSFWLVERTKRSTRN